MKPVCPVFQVDDRLQCFSCRMAQLAYDICLADRKALVSLWLCRCLPECRTTSRDHSFPDRVVVVACLEKGRVIFSMAFATGFLVPGAYSYLGASLHEVADGFLCRIGLASFTVGMVGKAVFSLPVVGSGRCAGSRCTGSVGFFLRHWQRESQ